MKINENWLKSMRELAAIQSGDVDVPYALQWARRPVTFTLQNYILWGVGIPLGLLSIGGLLWMAWRMIKGDWPKHILLWIWVAFLLTTQSLRPVKSMRYIISILPGLALIASWTIFKLMENGGRRVRKLRAIAFNWRKALAMILLVITIAGTVIYAIAFTGIYSKPVTRVAASEWIYENIPGAINLSFTSSETGEEFNQPLAYQNSALIASDAPYTYVFTAAESGKLTTVSIEHVQTQSSDTALTSLIATLYEVKGEEKNYRAAGFYQSTFTQSSDGRGEKVVIALEGAADLYAGRQYQLLIEVAEPGIFLRLSGAVSLAYGEGNGASIQYLPAPVYRLSSSTAYQTFIYPRESGELSSITLNRVVDLLETPGEKILTASLIDPNNPEAILASGSITGTFLPENDPRGESTTITFNKPVMLEKSTGYTLGLTLTGDGELGIYNDTTTVESSWDDSLPVSMYGYNQFGYWDGIYGNNRNMELYWDDNEEKLASLTLNLDQTDAIFISSSRQWGSITRIPERYPLTTEYYRALIGCPAGKDILWCYSVAEPGMFQGELGFDLVAVFQNDPQIGNIKFNDQFAEEAFTVYDHPKVLIFHKTDTYDSQKVREVLGAVDLTAAVHLTPSEANSFHGNLKLSQEESERDNKRVVPGRSCSRLLHSLIENRGQQQWRGIWQ